MIPHRGYWRGTIPQPSRQQMVQRPVIVSPVTLGKVNKIVVVILVYNRLENLRRWIDCWKMCNQDNAEMVVVHNYDPGMDVREYQKLCTDNRIRYIPRKNIGFDLGAFQDICRERLLGFDNNWLALLWIADDTWAMSKEFVKSFLEGINQPGVGISCMEISNEVTPHVRTTGFCIRKEVSKRLQFPAEVITTKQQCYLFEHRGDQKTMFRQLIAMGMRAVQISDIANSPLWDSHHRRYLRREREYSTLFSNLGYKIQDAKVVFICLAYNTFPEMISSLINQTYKNWELVLIHDGPCKINLKGLVDVIGDSRINYIETKTRVGNWGHSLRQWALNELKEKRLSEDADFVVIGNSDNHLVPVFIEYMLQGFKKNSSAVACYCSEMVHSYLKWTTQSCKLERGHIDCGGVMIRKDIACAVGWNNITNHSADWLFFNDIIKVYGKNSFVPVKGTLLIHN